MRIAALPSNEAAKVCMPMFRRPLPPSAAAVSNPPPYSDHRLTPFFPGMVVRSRFTPPPAGRVRLRHITDRSALLRPNLELSSVEHPGVRHSTVPPSSFRISQLLEPDSSGAAGDFPMESAKELEARVKALKALVADLNKRVKDLKMKENAVSPGNFLRTSGSAGAASSSYSSKDIRENEKEKERNDVLAALAREAGWTVEPEGTTYRHSPMLQNQQNLGTYSARSGDSPLSSNPLKKCLQEGKHRNGKLSLAHVKPALSGAHVDHNGSKEINSKGYSNVKLSEVVGSRRNRFNNQSKEGQPNIVNGFKKGCYTIFIENVSEKIHWKRLGSIFGSHGQVIDAFIPKKRNSKGFRFGFIRFATIEEARTAISKMNGNHIYGNKIRVSLTKYKPRQSFWRKSSTAVQSKSGMEDLPRFKHCEVEGAVDEDKLQVLNNCLVGWCKNFIKIGNLANQIQAKGLAGFTLMRAAGNVVLMVFEDSDLLRSVKEDKLETLAEWFSRVETWSESLVVESRRVWLVCEGIPFHAWNWDTFKNIATKWGKLIAIDNSCEFPSSFDRAKIQILTNAQGRIDELLELKVGDNLFKILVHEKLTLPSNLILGSLKIAISL
ncbi:hypothetical protein F3Y22_tig00003721pilonHSYRG00352 [Hibiscus syriacus]|uniref:RRM domain-containing protein n=1 Tax=Hibiscus syriacus TaxID=106335 RepID=A0A6A3CKT9_HIBSY|nr:hypothetical protein F3Y22_tig00003721pilonHSYRG00352 [Hibiscus syriacus]